MIRRLLRTRPVLLTLAAINGAAALACLVISMLWMHRPTDVETSGVLWMIASLLLETMTGLLGLLFLLTVVYIGYDLRRNAGANNPFGACASCGYDRRGLAAEAKCPECGAVPSK